MGDGVVSRESVAEFDRRNQCPVEQLRERCADEPTPEEVERCLDEPAGAFTAFFSQMGADGPGWSIWYVEDGYCTL